MLSNLKQKPNSVDILRITLTIKHTYQYLSNCYALLKLNFGVEFKIMEVFTSLSVKQTPPIPSNNSCLSRTSRKLITQHEFV